MLFLYCNWPVGYCPQVWFLYYFDMLASNNSDESLSDAACTSLSCTVHANIQR